MLGFDIWANAVSPSISCLSISDKTLEDIFFFETGKAVVIFRAREDTDIMDGVAG